MNLMHNSSVASGMPPRPSQPHSTATTLPQPLSSEISNVRQGSPMTCPIQPPATNLSMHQPSNAYLQQHGMHSQSHYVPPTPPNAQSQIRFPNTAGIASTANTASYHPIQPQYHMPQQQSVVPSVITTQSTTSVNYNTHGASCNPYGKTNQSSAVAPRFPQVQQPPMPYPGMAPQQPFGINQPSVHGGYPATGQRLPTAAVSTGNNAVQPLQLLSPTGVEGGGHISDIKLKPIVPQPGTATTPSMQPISAGMNPGQASFDQTSNLRQYVSNAPQSTGATVMSVERTPLVPTVKRSGSFDDMLNNEQSDTDGASSIVTLQPKVMTPKELAEQKRQAKAFNDIAKATHHDPYENSKMQTKLIEDVKMLEDKLFSADGGGEKWLNEKWKIFNTFLSGGGGSGFGPDQGGGGALSVARCYPMKNRAPDVLPFDSSRVELPTTKDDYINASHIRHLSPHAPCFIATQWPPANTHNDFWTMVWQEQIETIVCLLGESSPPISEKDIYWPSERKEPLKMGGGKSSPGVDDHMLEITLQSMQHDELQTKEEKELFSRTERIFTLLNRATNTSRVVIHIQLLANTQAMGKHLVSSLSELAATTLTYHCQQRVLTHPILVHCLEGAGRTAAFILMTAAMSEINVANERYVDEGNAVEKGAAGTSPSDGFRIMPDIVKMAALLCQQRKGALRERHHFKQAYEGMLCHARNILVKKGVLKVPAICLKGGRHYEKDESQKSPGGGLNVVEDTIGLPFVLQKRDVADDITLGATAITNCDKTDFKEGSLAEEGEHKSTSITIGSNSNFIPTELLTNKLADLNLSADPLGLASASKSSSSPHKRRITKQDFINTSNTSLSKIGTCASVENITDPLSQLDPLWSMK